MTIAINGQWLAKITGTNSGQAILELDDEVDHFAGVAYMYDDDPALPSFYAEIRTPSRRNHFRLSLVLVPLDTNTSAPIDLPTFKERFKLASDAQYPVAESEWFVTKDEIKVDWSTNMGTSGSLLLKRSPASKPSEYTALNIKSWGQFKNYVSKIEPYRYIFRGQSDARWRLRTHFHRTGRANLLKFINRDIPQLYNLLTGQTKHIFNLASPVENGAFYSLAQHHGYPTPLLDWTYSPFVAVHFAYKGLRKGDRSSQRKTRIFVFDSVEWQKSFNQVQKLSPARPHFSLMHALAINNPRLVPQQAILTVTNMDDIESYIRSREVETGKTFLQVIDLPSVERPKIVPELALMGITAGSLFPGLDGACEQLRERFFDL